MTEERPNVEDPLALYWVWGTIDAIKGIKYEDCPLREGMNTRRIWEAGYKAYVDEKKNLKTGKEKRG